MLITFILYYNNLYADIGCNGSSSLDISSIILDLFTDLENNSLTVVLSVEEIKITIFSMHKNSASGLDGF